MADKDGGWDVQEEERLMRTLSRSATGGQSAGYTAKVVGATSPRQAGVARVASNTSSPSLRSSQQSSEIDGVRKQRLNIQSMMNAGRRELDQVNAELARLTQKKADLESTQARRQEQLDQLVSQMESLEASAASASAAAPSSAPVQSGSAPYQYRDPVPAASSPAAPHISPAVARQVFTEGDDDAEAARLMKTLSRAGRAPAAARIATVDPEADERRKAKAEEDRQRREDNEARRREEDTARRDRETEQRLAEEAELAKLFEGGGEPTLFQYKECFDFEASCNLVGDFTGWKPIPMRRNSDGLDFEVTVPLQAGRTYFYYYSVDGKIEIEKGKPTGLGNGRLCNRLNL
jgi:cell division septum initiation protein DivIVA